MKNKLQQAIYKEIENLKQLSLDMEQYAMSLKEKESLNDIQESNPSPIGKLEQLKTELKTLRQSVNENDTAYVTFIRKQENRLFEIEQELNSMLSSLHIRIEGDKKMETPQSLSQNNTVEPISGINPGYSYYDLLNKKSTVHKPDIQTRPQENMKPIAHTMPQENVISIAHTMPQESMLSSTHTLPQENMISSTHTLPQGNVNPNTYTNPQENVTSSSKKIEFRAGSSILGVLGVLLILIAFATLAINFFTNLGQGICLYAFSALILVSAEYIFKKRSAKFANILRSLSISCFYLSTIINYLYLEILNGVAAMLLTVLITAASLYLCHRNQSRMIKLIALVGCYVSLYPLEHFSNTTSYLICSIILWTVSVAYLILNQEQTSILSDLAYIIINSAYAALMFHEAYYNPNVINITGVIYVAVTVALLLLLYLRTSSKFHTIEDSPFDVCMIYKYAQMVPVLLLYFFIIIDLPKKITRVDFLPALCILIGTELIFLYLYKEKERFDILVHIFALLIFGLTLDPLLYLPFILLIANRILLDQLQQDISINLDYILTAVCFIASFWLSDSFYLGYILIYIVSLFLVYTDQDHFFTIIQKYHTFGTIILFIVYRILPPLIPNKEEVLILCIVTSILIIVTYLCTNHISLLRHTNMTRSNIVLIILLLILQLAALDSNTWQFLLLLLCGCFVFIYLLREEYISTCKLKPLFFAIYLTYMFFAFCLLITDNLSTLVSIGLMVIALISVFAGTKLVDKSLRIYGLIMAYFVCIKVVVYDLYGSSLLQKTILFGVIGVIALIISYVYIKLEQYIKEKEREL